MKKNIAMFLLFISVFILSCSKSSNSSNSTINDITINNVGGTYKGSTLIWYTNTTNGSDPNFSFTVTYLGNQSCKLDIITSAPLITKSYTLQLTSQNYSPVTSTSSGIGFGSYTFSNSSISLLILLHTSAIGFTASAQIDNSQTMTSLHFTGDGKR